MVKILIILGVICGWGKISNKNVHGVEIHFKGIWENRVIKAIDDFKFK